MRRLSRAKVLWAIRSIGWICGSRSGSRLVSVYNSSASQGVQPVQSRELRLLHDQRKQCQLRQAVVQQQSGLPAAHAAIGLPDHVLEEKRETVSNFLRFRNRSRSAVFHGSAKTKCYLTLLG